MSSVRVVATTRLAFGPDDPVRSASAVAAWRDGWVVVQDDAVDVAWWRPRAGSVDRVRVLPDRGGLEVFSEAEGTKHLKPDLEAGCTLDGADGDRAVLLLGSGSLPDRTHAVLLPEDGHVVAADLAPLHARIQEALGLADGQLNLEGAHQIADRVRCYQRGHGASGVPSASVDLPLRPLVAAVRGEFDPTAVEVARVQHLDLGAIDGVALSVTDAVLLPDGRVCVSATAEDTPDPVADGPVAGSALAILAPDGSAAQLLPLPSQLVGCKVEGLAVAADGADGITMLAVVDQDDPTEASLAVHLLVPADATPRHGRQPGG